MTHEMIATSATDNATTKPIDVMASVMDNEEFVYTRKEDSLTGRFPMKGIIANLSIRFMKETVFFSVSYNIRTPRARRDEMNHFISTSNWELCVTTLEMDPEDGEVRLRFTYPLDTPALREETAGRLLFRMLRDANKLSDGILAAFSGSPVMEKEGTDDEI